MTTRCTAPGCTKNRAGLSRYCSAHRNRAQRYGHPVQASVSSRDLSPFVCRVASRIPDDGELRGMMDGRWRGLLDHVATVATSGIVRGPLGDPSGDRRASPVEREAARRFMTTAKDTNAREVADTVIGLRIMEAVRPEVFEDDRAFRFILARRFFGLSPTNAVKDRRTGSTTFRAYPVDVVLVVTGWLLGAFDEVAGKIAEREVAELGETKEREEHARETLARL